MSCDTCGLLVNNAPEFLNEDTMNAIFSMYGINKVVAIDLPSSDRSPISYLVIYSSKEEASEAIGKLNGILPFKFDISPYPPPEKRFDNSNVSLTADSSQISGSSCDPTPRSNLGSRENIFIEYDKQIEDEEIVIQEENIASEKDISEENYNNTISESSMPKVFLHDIYAKKSRKSLDETFTVVYQLPQEEDCPGGELNDSEQVNESDKSSLPEISDNSITSKQRIHSTSSTGWKAGLSSLGRRARSAGVRINLNSMWCNEVKEMNTTMSLQDFKKLKASKYSNRKLINGRNEYHCNLCDRHFLYFKDLKIHIKEAHLEGLGRYPTVLKKPARAHAGSDESTLVAMGLNKR